MPQNLEADVCTYEAEKPRPSGPGSALVREFERVPALFYGLFFVVYGLYAALASTRRLWYDELLTYHLAQLPLSGLWAAISRGADLNPPLSHALTRLSFLLLGVNDYTVRLPSILAFAAMCVCLSVFVSRRAGKAYGFLALTAPLLTGIWSFATEARPYALLLAFATAALLSWQIATERATAGWAIGTLFLSLCGAMYSHIFGVLVVGALLLGEICRMWQTRKINPKIICAILLPVAAAALYIPLILNAHHYPAGPNYYDRPRLGALTQSCQDLLAPALWVILLALALTAAASTRAPNNSVTRLAPRIGSHELVCLGAFCAIPIASFLVAIALQSGFAPRYCAPAILGLVPLFCFWLHRQNRGAPAIALATALVCLAFFLLKPLVNLVDGQAPRLKDFKAADLARTAGDQPVVFANALMFLEADHYDFAELGARLAYVWDRKTALAYTGSPLGDHLSDLPKSIPIHGQIAGYQQFLKDHDAFVVLASLFQPDEWLVQKLMADGYHVEFLGEYGSRYGAAGLFRVTAPAKAASR